MKANGSSGRFRSTSLTILLTTDSSCIIGGVLHVCVDRF